MRAGSKDCNKSPGLCVCVCANVFTNLIFLQSDLAHLSVTHKGAGHLVDALPCSNSDDVVCRYEARSHSNLPLTDQKVQHCCLDI